MIALVIKLTVCAGLVLLLANLAWRHGPHWAEKALTGGLLLLMIAPWGGFVSIGGFAQQPTTQVVQVAPETLPALLRRPLDTPEVAAAENTAPSPQSSSQAIGQALVAVWPWLAWVWGIGAVLVCARLVLGLAMACKAARCGTLFDGKQQPAIVESKYVDSPFLWSFGKPVIVLPDSHRQWSAEQREHVLQHERSHWQRADGYRLLVGHFATALFWWHPLVWVLARAQRTAIEASCDAEVLKSGVDSQRYAQTLYNLAHTQARMVVPTATDSHSIVTRIRRILQAPLYQRWTAPSRTGAVALVGMMAGVASVSFASSHAGQTSEFALLNGPRLTYEHFGRIPAATLQVVAFYDGGPNRNPTMQLELVNRRSGEKAWLEFNKLPKFDQAIPAWEFALAPNVEPTGDVRIAGVEPDGVIDGLAFGVMWRNSAGDYDSFRSVSHAPTRIPTEVCSWPLSVIDIPRAEAMSTDQIWHLTSLRHAICGAELLPDGTYRYGRG